MPFVVAGMFGLGGPEVLVVFLVLLLIIFLIGRAVGKSKIKQFSRFCPKCGRGLDQPKDASCCAYCGFQLP